MRLYIVLVFFLVVSVVGCKKAEPPKEMIVKINDYVITADEFEEGFERSAYAVRDDKVIARNDYLENLVNQKLIVQYAMTEGLDQRKDFLESVEHFWEQSLMTVTLGMKTRDIHQGMKLTDEHVRRLYDEMIQEKLTEKSYGEMYPQIRWQAERQLESQRLNDWISALRKGAEIEVNRAYLRKTKTK